jgi:predicted lipoprotein
MRTTLKVHEAPTASDGPQVLLVMMKGGVAGLTVMLSSGIEPVFLSVRVCGPDDARIAVGPNVKEAGLRDAEGAMP